MELSDKAKDYYEQLKGKFNNMDFIVVSKDMKSQVKQNAASYGNANNMVVLIGEDELERMATDESFRKKYEGIIQMAKSRLSEFKNSLTSSGAGLMNYGMSVDENGKESFFATVEKSQDLQKKRIEKKAAEKKEHKAQEKKKAEKERREERIEEARKKRKAGKAEKETDDEDVEKVDEQKEYITFESSSLDDLISKVSSYSYNNASAKVMTDAERMVGGNIDFRG